MTSKTIVGMTPCLVTHHILKAETALLRSKELRAGLVKDGCPEALLGDLDTMIKDAAALCKTLHAYRDAQENAMVETREANRQRRLAEDEARRAARLAAKASSKPVQVATPTETTAS